MRKLLLILIITIMLFATGCTTKSESLNKPIEPLEGFTNTEYNKETDHQSFFSEYSGIVAVDDGYIINYFGFLYLLDENKEIVPLCSNIDCEHKDESCDSYIGNSLFLQYYNGDLYYISYSSGMELYKKSLDGSKVEMICTINSEYFPVICVHRGYAYFSYELNENSAALYRVKLNSGAKIEMVYKVDGYAAEIDRIKGYGDGVLFVEFTADDKDFSNTCFNIMYYDSEEDAVFTMKEDTRGDYVMANGDLYYTMYDGLYCYDMENKTDSYLMKPQHNSYLSYDGKYIYLDDSFSIIDSISEGRYIEETSEGRYILHENEDDIEGTVINYETYVRLTSNGLTVIDLNGNIIDKIDIGQYDCFYGDEKNLFRMTDLGIAMFDKSQIGTGEHEWIEFLLSNKNGQ